MIISINGSSGTGKTTLANALGSELGIPVVAERFKPIIQAREVWRKAQKLPLMSANARQFLVRKALEWMSSHHETISSKADAIFDRSCFDILELFLSLDLGNDGGDLLGATIAECLKQSRAYDLVILLPLSKWSFNLGPNENGLARSLSPSKKLRSHTTKIGLLEQYCSGPRLYVNESCETTEQRVKFVINALCSLEKLSEAKTLVEVSGRVG